MQAIDYIFLAEFDIDAGSCLRHAYPRLPENTDEHWFAEMMLPDGVHNRTEDWTMFFLNRSDVTVAGRTTAAATAYSFDDSTQEWVLLRDGSVTAEATSPPCRVKATKDGDVIFESAVGAEMQFTVLRPGFVSLYAEDGTAFGLLFENPDEASTFAIAVASPKQVATVTVTNQAPFLFCLNCVHTVKDVAMPRGARVCALAVASRSRFINVFRPLLVLALDSVFAASDTKSVLVQLFDTINTLDFDGIPVLSPAMQVITRNSFINRQLSHWSMSVKWQDQLVPMDVLHNLGSDDVSSSTMQVSVGALVDKFGEKSLIIFNAVLMERRIVFLGYGIAANDVCGATLAAALLVCPPMNNLLRTRVFPYCNLFDLEFLQHPGFIAGTTNPMFRQHTEWWDVLADLNTGDVCVSPAISSHSFNSLLLASAGVDRDFFETLEPDQRRNEPWIRRQFELYTRTIVDSSFGGVVLSDDQTALRLKEANAFRISQWSTTRAARVYLSQTGPGAHDVVNLVRRLQVRKELHRGELLQLLGAMTALLNDDVSALELLSHFHECEGGLQPLAICLLHHDEAVRSATVKICMQIDALSIGKAFMSALNSFLMLTFERARVR